MKMSAGWPRATLYGFAILLCQPLAACGTAEKPTAEKADSGKATTPVPDNAPLVIAFGDSLYAGYQLGPREGLAPQLQAALAADGVIVRVQNAGVSGDTSAAGRQRLTFVLDNAKTKPALVVLGLGGNDMLRGISPEQTRANLDAMLAELKKRDIPVVLTGMVAAPNLGADYASKFNPMYADLAAKYETSLYPFILDNVVTDKGLMLSDNIHPNAKGVKVIVEGLAPLVEEALPDAK